MRLQPRSVCAPWAGALIVVIFFGSSAAAEPLARKRAIELLWPAGAPGAHGTGQADKPSITVCLPTAGASARPAVVICPGGGYATLALDHEGDQIADWLNSLGMPAFILRYRHSGGGYQHPAPLQDAQRAIQLVRSRASQWHVDPARVGILGFSAGGHLASTAGTHFDRGNPKSRDLVDRQSCRPDFMILAYPVISLTSKHMHRGSLKNLLGEKPDPELVKSLSNELQVTAETPPTFIMHTAADVGVLPENSLLFYSALRQAGVPAELHIYERGEHGLGLAQGVPGVSAWPAACATWLRVRGILESEKQEGRSQN